MILKSTSVLRIHERHHEWRLDCHSLDAVGLHHVHRRTACANRSGTSPRGANLRGFRRLLESIVPSQVATYRRIPTSNATIPPKMDIRDAGAKAWSDLPPRGMEYSRRVKRGECSSDRPAVPPWFHSR